MGGGISIQCAYAVAQHMWAVSLPQNALLPNVALKLAHKPTPYTPKTHTLDSVTGATLTFLTGDIDVSNVT